MKKVFSALKNINRTFAIICTVCSVMMLNQNLNAQSAGPNQTICQYYGNQVNGYWPEYPIVTMAATGTGIWSQLNTNPIAAIIGNVDSAATRVANLTLPGVYRFVWTTGSGPDTMTVTVLPSPPKPVLSDLGYCLSSDSIVVHAGEAVDSIRWWLDSEIFLTTTGADSFYRAALAENMGGFEFGFAVSTSSSFGCISLWSDTVVVNNCGNAGPNQTLCQYNFNINSNNVQLVTAATGIGVWSDVPSNPTVLTIASPNSPVTSISGLSVPGVYHYVWTTGGMHDTLTITINPAPLIPTISATGTCLGNDTLILHSNSVADSIVWVNENSNLHYTVAALDTSFIADSAGLYFAYLIGVNGCKSLWSDTTRVITCPSNTGFNQTVCQGGSITTAATGSGSWTALSTNPSVAFIENSSSPTTAMSDFDSVGVYAFKWGSDTLYVTVFANPNITPVLDYLGPCQDTLVVHGPAGTVSAGWVGESIGLPNTDTILAAPYSGAYYAVVYSNVGCHSLVSNTLNVNIISPTVSISPNASQLHVCYGVADTFVASVTNGGTAPVYQWYQDNVPAGSNSSVFVTSTALNYVSVQVTSNLPCASPLTAFSGEDTFYVYPVPAAPRLDRYGSCLNNDSLVITNSPTDTIEWLLNGSPLHQSPPNILYYIPTSIGLYSAYYKGSDGCNSVVSDTMDVISCGAAGPNQTICLNSTATMAGTGTGNWVALAANPAATVIAIPSSPATTITGFTVAGVYWYQWGTLAGDTMYIDVYASTPAVARVTSDQAFICSGSVDTFKATINVTGTNETYQWYIGWTPVGTNTDTLITTLQTTYTVSDSVRVRVTTNAPCANPDTAFNYFQLFVYPLPNAPTLSVAGSCLGTDSLVVTGLTDPLKIDWYSGSTLLDTIVYPPVIAAGGNGAGSAANQLHGPYGVAIDRSGNLYVADVDNYRVQKFPAGSSSLTNGVTVAGGNGSGAAANQLSRPDAIALDAAGNLYVSDESNNRIQKFPAGSNSATNGVTVAGGNGQGSAANQFMYATGVSLDSAGNIYVSDADNNRVQKFPPNSTSSTNGVTVAGGNGPGPNPDQIQSPQSVFADPHGNIYVTDEYYGIKRFPAGINSGTIVATGNNNGTGLAGPEGIYVDGNGILYVADAGNNRIVQFPAGSNANTVGVTVAGGDLYFGYGSAINLFIDPLAVYLDSAGNMYIADAGNNRIVKWSSNSIHSAHYVPAAAGNYTVTYIGTNGGCTSLQSNSVTVNSCHVTSDTLTICRGSADTLQPYLTPGSYSTYIWTPGTGLSDPHSLNPVASPTVTTQYILSTVDTGVGGLVHDTVLVLVDTLCHDFVWPGDADNNGLVDNTDLLPIGLTYNFNGPARNQQDMLWYAHYSTPWAGTILGGINDNYTDCDGNGTVDLNDVNAILNNYSLTHAKAGDFSQNRSGNPDLKMVIMPDTLLNGDTLICHIILGDSITSANNVYGLAFTVNFNPIVVDSGSVKMTFPDSWLATQSEHITLAKNNVDDGAIYAGLSRIDQTARSGSGEIATVSMVITTDNIDGKNLSYYTDQLSISFVKVINQLGDTIPVNRYSDSAIIGFLPTGIINNKQEAVNVKLYPDPANNQAQIRSIGGKMTNIVLNDVLGRHVATYDQINASNYILPTADLRPGVYFAQIIVGGNVVVKKFLVQH